MTAEILTVSTYNKSHLPAIRQKLLDVYAEVWAEQAAQDPFFSVERYGERLDGHAKGGDWTCTVGDINGETVGYAYGRLDSVQEWTTVLRPTSPEVRDYGRRGTFGLCEIMVRAPWRGKGIGRVLHQELMQQRKEARASLLIDTHPRQNKTRALYEKWGYRKVGQMQPFADSPLYDAMILELRSDHRPRT